MTDEAVIPPVVILVWNPILIKDTPISLSVRISNLLVVTTFGATVYPDPPSIRSTLITCPLLTSTFALAPPPVLSLGMNFNTGGVKY